MKKYFAGIEFETEELENIIDPFFTRLITVNNEYIYHFHNDISFRSSLTNGKFICDGRIPYLFSKWFYKNKISNITGIEIINYIANSDQYKSVLFIGDTDENNGQIVTFFDELKSKVIGWNPVFDDFDHLKLSEDFFKFDAVFVALGCKKQEKFINHFSELMIKSGVKLVAGVGGAYSIYLKKRNLPSIIYRLGLASFWRLFQEFKLFRLVRIIRSIKAIKYYFY